MSAYGIRAVVRASYRENGAYRQGQTTKLTLEKGDFVNSGNFYYCQNGAVFLLSLSGNCFLCLGQILPNYANCYNVRGYCYNACQAVLGMGTPTVYNVMLLGDFK